MIHTIDLDDDTSALLECHTALTGLSAGELIDRLLGVHLQGLHEMLALVSAHPSSQAEVANLLQSFGPESLIQGVRRIAPAGYMTLSEQFAHGAAQALSSSRATF